MSDIKSLKELYLLCFTDDTPEDADFLFENVFSHAHLLEEKAAGKTISMLYLMDCSLKGEKCDLPYFYLYAACTHPDFRGKGIMGRLLEKAKAFAKEKGKMGIILKPANKSLFKFYENYGFKSFFKFSSLFLEASDSFMSQELSFIPLSQWHEERKGLLNSLTDVFVSFGKELFCAAASECKVATDKKGSFVVYELRDDLLLCKECLCETSSADGIINIVQTLLAKTGLKRAEIRLPKGFSADGIALKDDCFSVISEIPFDAQNPYHGFAFD